MENANKALIMAGSTLIGVMLLTIFVAFISSVSVWPETEDTLENAEQVAAFNAEYEVYQKSAMYGVDVISCLNKAKSNNEKYAEGGSFLGQLAYGNNYLIDVSVKITSSLTESIEVTAMKDSARGLIEGAIYDTVQVSSKELKDVFDINTDDSSDKKQLTDFEEDEALYYQMSKENGDFKKDNAYHLLGTIVENDGTSSSVDEDANILIQLLNHSDQPRQIVKNKDASTYKYNSAEKGWVTATWTTYLYSFKQKRFKCTNLEYSSKTGLVNLIEFEEI